ncbi:AAA family ATPase [Lysinibacillus boronitolerans]|uniref:AAA family ATPase n=1 Tax=Lysinibacillus boronitolerans TaxID=309788 RepID=UPI001EE65D62|nr:AAA family ATPase [Lysinibacillus boronitolerans]
MAIIKIKKINIQNLRNVRQGEIVLAVNFETFLQANVVGLYGQNGSGKTTIVDAFSLLKTLISGWLTEMKLPSKEKRLILAGEQTASMNVEFLVENQFGTFFCELLCGATGGSAPTIYYARTSYLSRKYEREAIKDFSGSDREGCTNPSIKTG